MIVVLLVAASIEPALAGGLWGSSKCVLSSGVSSDEEVKTVLSQVYLCFCLRSEVCKGKEVCIVT